MKPDWKDAPEWANWLAMDGDGLWYWYEGEPTIDCYQNHWFADGKEKLAMTPGNPAETKERRP